MNIRPERPEDAAAIHDLTARAFRDMPFSSQTEAAIVDALRDAGAMTLSLVAEDGGQIVGHVAFSPVTIDGEAGGWYGLGPVSVEPERQKAGIGKALIREGLEQLQKAGAHGCVLVGEPGYYQRFGFASDPALKYADVPGEYVQRLVFKGAPPAGEITYHAAFDAH